MSKLPKNISELTLCTAIAHAAIFLPSRTAAGSIDHIHILSGLSSKVI